MAYKSNDFRGNDLKGGAEHVGMKTSTPTMTSDAGDPQAKHRVPRPGPVDASMAKKVGTVGSKGKLVSRKDGMT